MVYIYNYVRAVRYDETVVNPTYVVVDTNQTTNWNNSDEEGDSFYGQDAQYEKNAPNYTNNGDDTVTDNNTGLMWQKSPDTNGDIGGTEEALDFSAGVTYLAGIGVLKTTTELETLFSTIPDPATVATSFGITEVQALTLMEDHLGIVDQGVPQDGQGPPPM